MNPGGGQRARSAFDWCWEVNKMMTVKKLTEGECPGRVLRWSPNVQWTNCREDDKPDISTNQRRKISHHCSVQLCPLCTLLGVQSELLALGIMLYIPQNTNIHENMFLIVLSDSGDNLKRKLVGYNASNSAATGPPGISPRNRDSSGRAMADYRQIFSLDSILMVWYNIENFRSIKVSPIHLVDAGGSGWCTELRIGSLREFRGGQTFKSSVNDRTLNLKNQRKRGLMLCIL